MSTVSYTYPTLSSPASNTEVTKNFNDVAGVVNGNLTNDNFASNGALDLDKLAGKHQFIHADLTFWQTAGGMIAGVTGENWLVPIPGLTGDAAWTVRKVSWQCSDTGAGTGQVTLQYGGFNEGGSVGSWATVATIGTYTIANGAGANDGNGVAEVTAGSTSLAVGAGVRGLRLIVAVADATALTAANTFLTVSVMLRREIQAA